MSQYSPGAPVWLSCIVVYMPLAAVDTKCIDIKDAHGCLLISGRSLEDLFRFIARSFSMVFTIQKTRCGLSVWFYAGGCTAVCTI